MVDLAVGLALLALNLGLMLLATVNLGRNYEPPEETDTYREPSSAR